MKTSHNILTGPMLQCLAPTLCAPQRYPVIEKPFTDPGDTTNHQIIPYFVPQIRDRSSSWASNPPTTDLVFLITLYALLGHGIYRNWVWISVDSGCIAFPLLLLSYRFPCDMIPSIDCCRYPTFVLYSISCVVLPICYVATVSSAKHCDLKRFRSGGESGSYRAL